MKSGGELILGLDVGARSVGWAVVGTAKGKPVNLKATGVRVFDAGVEGDIEQGRDESKAAARREARLARRRLDRTARRMNHLFHLLQSAGLLPGETPKGETRQTRETKSETRHSVMVNLDRELTKKWASEGRRLGHLLPYSLRAHALDEKLEPFELGRSLYHLAQRRGFLSNRKSTPKKDEKPGEVKAGITELEEKMKAAGARTLGEYFAGLDPEEERIRKRWTARSMFEEEFKMIWASQARFHPGLTEDLKETVHRTIFHQRPLKSAKGLVGRCQFEAGCRRAPMASLAAQEFRMLQKVNDLTYKLEGEVDWHGIGDQRDALIEELEQEGDQTFEQIRKLLDLPKKTEWSHAEGGEKKIPGNRTESALRKVFEEKWDLLSIEDKDEVVEDLLSIQKHAALEKRGTGKWGLSEEKAKELAGISPEEGYCGLSRKALSKLLPRMEQGTPYATAAKEVYGEEKELKAMDELPAVRRAVANLRNPAVERALTEVRKVVSAIVREHGVPGKVRIELARELRKPRKDRERIWKDNRENETKRDKAKTEIQNKWGVPNPSRDDILKMQLWEECGGFCPYTGKPISKDSLFGKNPQFDIEHIIPFSQSLDDSFMNKTLCYMDENRNKKKNQTPFEAYGSEPARYKEILQRVNKFQGRGRHAKLRLFRLEKVDDIDGFTHSQLNDTKYASKATAEYLGRLYGADFREHVETSKGGVTKFLRDEWGLNRILGDGGEKSRDDHRHHAVDALATALTDRKTIGMLSDAAMRAVREGRRRFGKVAEPWPGFYEEVRQGVEKIVVSHRTSRKVSGPLHEETVYGPMEKNEKGKEFVRVRKNLERLSKSEIEEIADPVVKKLVEEKLAELGGDVKKFGDEKNHPALKAKDGRLIPIHKVRLKKVMGAVNVGSKEQPRHVKTGSNHHLEIYEVKDKKGKVKWDGAMVTMLEAVRRQANKAEVVCHNAIPEGKFVFSLAPGDSVEAEDKDGQRKLFIVRVITENNSGYKRVDCVHCNDARKKADIVESGEVFRFLVEPLRKAKCQKVAVDPLGRVRRAND